MKKNETKTTMMLQNSFLVIMHNGHMWDFNLSDKDKKSLESLIKYMKENNIKAEDLISNIPPEL